MDEPEKRERVMLTPVEMVAHLKTKGVRFDICTEEEAVHTLQEHNNYFKLTAYRKNYSKHPGGIHRGKYIDLDFAYLQELSILDMRLRYEVLQMCLDIEHYLKTTIISSIEAWDRTQCYQMVDEFYHFVGTERAARIKRSLDPALCDIYRRDLVIAYSPRYPIWAFAEVISFGDLIRLYLFVVEKISCEACSAKEHCEGCKSKKARNRMRLMLQAVRSLRNACAHNSCILNDLSRSQGAPTVQFDVRQRLYQTALPAKYIQPRLRCARVGQMLTMFFLHEHFVTSEHIRRIRLEEIRHVICERFQKHQAYFDANYLISDTFHFLKAVLDNWHAPC